MKPNPTTLSTYIKHHCHQSLQTVLLRSQQLSTYQQQLSTLITAVEHVINARERVTENCAAVTHTAAAQQPVRGR